MLLRQQLLLLLLLLGLGQVVVCVLAGGQLLEGLLFLDRSGRDPGNARILPQTPSIVIIIIIILSLVALSLVMVSAAMAQVDGAVDTAPKRR